MLNHKQLIVNILRQTHLLRFANYILFLRNVLKNREANRRFLIAHPGSKVPPIRLAYEAYNYTTWQGYLDLGTAHARLLHKLIDENISQAEVKVCEWGCGPARVIRHLVNLPGHGKVELFGTDYDEETIRWCRENIPDISFLKNGLTPPLPFSTDSLDVVYAISVLTHLSEEMQLAWVRELFRVLRPNGILIVTTNGNLVSNDKLLPHEKALYEDGKLVTRDKDKEGAKLFSAFHPPEYIKQVFFKDFDILIHIDDPRTYSLLQDVWVARKNCSSS
jgi:SAM-dependent methyltransferase